MADTRINALSTATSSVSDDFVPIDGATNGTRKLSAYSPTFGGNATVGGTLTVSGASTSSVAGSFGIGTTTPTSYAARVLQINDSSGSTSAGIKLTNNTTGVTNDDGLDITMSGSTGYIIQRENASLIFQTNSTTALTLNSSQGATIAGTTASTSTSTGALVVSGGVGVAGSINAGTTGANHSHVFTGGDLGSGSTILVARDSNGTNQFIVGGSGIVQITNGLQLNGASNVFRIVSSQTPASASATGTAGTICWDTSYIYVCTATNTWKRVAISTW